MAPGLVSVEEILALGRFEADTAEANRVVGAYEWARKAHSGQTRKSGEPYFVHPAAVAAIVAELGADEDTVAAALLHDTVEDTESTLEELSALFSPTVAEIVDGVTKLDRLSFASKEAQQAATMRKMLIAMAKDPRVLVIKLADRLHNVRTLSALSVDKQRRIAQETLDIYAPLAHRLGIEEIKWQLEDISFAALHPRRYAEIDYMVSSRAPEREQLLEVVRGELTKRLEVAGVEAEVSGRPKHLWSIYEKMVVKGKDFDSIYDFIGVRIITETERDCWAALGVVHALWPPLPGRFKDYINAPKFNLYQSLHTTVLLDNGNPLEVQVRTLGMHVRAEYGIAAHWGYKDGADAKELAWLERIMEIETETQDPREFLENLKLDLDVDEVYVFTPKGRVITLPAGATPLDFAYAIHTEVGHRCIGAKANGRLVPLDSSLHSGDTIEIVSSRATDAGPSRDWLGIVKTARARTKIRQWFSRERREESVDLGKDELTKALRREGLPLSSHLTGSGLTQLAKKNGFQDGDALFVAVGEGHLSAKGVAQRLARQELSDDAFDLTASVVRKPMRTTKGPSIYVEGIEDVLVRLSRCCNPIPGDDIVGFVTKGRGVAVHRADCPNVISLLSGESGREVDVEWARETPSTYSMAIEVLALDRSRLLLDVSRILSEHHVNITSSSSTTGTDQVSRMRFGFDLAEPSHLDSILGSVRQLDGVYNAYRLIPGHAARERAEEENLS